MQRLIVFGLLLLCGGAMAARDSHPRRPSYRAARFPSSRRVPIQHASHTHRARRASSAAQVSAENRPQALQERPLATLETIREDLNRIVAAPDVTAGITGDADRLTERARTLVEFLQNYTAIPSTTAAMVGEHAEANKYQHSDPKYPTGTSSTTVSTANGKYDQVSVTLSYELPRRYWPSKRPHEISLVATINTPETAFDAVRQVRRFQIPANRKRDANDGVLEGIAKFLKEDVVQRALTRSALIAFGDATPGLQKLFEWELVRDVADMLGSHEFPAIYVRTTNEPTLFEVNAHIADEIDSMKAQLSDLRQRAAEQWAAEASTNLRPHVEAAQGEVDRLLTDVRDAATNRQQIDDAAFLEVRRSLRQGNAKLRRRQERLTQTIQQLNEHQRTLRDGHKRLHSTFDLFGPVAEYLPTYDTYPDSGDITRTQQLSYAQRLSEIHLRDDTSLNRKELASLLKLFDRIVSKSGSKKFTAGDATLMLDAIESIAKSCTPAAYRHLKQTLRTNFSGGKKKRIGARELLQFVKAFEDKPADEG